MTRRHTAERPLTELQQAILDFLWKQGPASADQVREAIRPRHVLKDASVRTLLRRLEARGYLTHSLDGKVFIYEATAARQNVAARAARLLIDRFWGGSAEQFLLGMVDEKVLTAAELRRLVKKVEGRK
jgi:BlaI family transcriptional regulator, penicillinase repressor